MDDLDAVLRGVHACPTGLTCRPGRGVLYPMPTRGRGGAPVDVLLVSWNPRNDWYARVALPDYATWRAEGEAALEAAVQRADPWARRVGALLPPGRRLDDGRTRSTFLWKWPTRFKTSEGESAFYAGRCVANHLDAELRALRPRVILTHDREAARHFAAEAERRGLALRTPASAVRSSEVLGWVEASDAWGWPMGLALVKDVEGDYHENTARWAHAVLARLLPDAAPGPHGRG